MTVNKKDCPSIKCFLFSSKISEKRKSSNTLLKSLNLIMAKDVPFIVFFSFTDIIVPARKLWLSSFGSSCGNLILDNGASEAITKKGKSILPVGIKEVEGKFNRGDLITCLDSDSKELARGISNFSSEELNKIKGLNSKDLYKTLGYASEEEAIHRNNLVIS